MKRVILDTNFIIYCIENKVHIEPELDRILDFPYEIAIIDKIQGELRKLAEDNKTRTSAQIALKLVQKWKIVETNEDGLVDILIIKSLKKGDLVATMDKELQKHLKCPYVIVRQRKYLELKNSTI